jgi:hypothetical protein
LEQEQMISVVSSIRIGEALVVTGETGRLYATSRPIHFQIKPPSANHLHFQRSFHPELYFGGIWGNLGGLKNWLVNSGQMYSKLKQIHTIIISRGYIRLSGLVTGGVKM